MTINKSHTRKVDAIFDGVDTAQVFRLDDGFNGRDVDARVAHEALYGSRGAKLYIHEGKATVHVHSNLWYEFPVSA